MKKNFLFILTLLFAFNFSIFCFAEDDNDSFYTAIDLSLADYENGSATVHFNGYTDDGADIIAYFREENTGAVYSTILSPKSNDLEDGNKNYIKANVNIPYGEYSIVMTKYGCSPYDDKIYTFVYEPFILIHNIEDYAYPVEFVVTDNFDTLKEERTKLSQWTRYVENFLALELKNVSKDDNGIYNISEVNYEWLGVYDTFKEIVNGNYIPKVIDTDDSELYSSLTTPISDMMTTEEAERQGIAEYFHSKEYYKQVEDIGWVRGEDIPEGIMLDFSQYESMEELEEDIDKIIEEDADSNSEFQDLKIKGYTKDSIVEEDKKTDDTLNSKKGWILIGLGFVFMLIPIITVIFFIIKKRK